MAVGLKFVIERELADGDGDGARAGCEVGVVLGMGHAEALHHGGVGSFLGDGGGREVDVAEFFL